MDSRLKNGIDLFNNGKFFDAHETWESYWNTLESPEKQIFQGVIQCSVALHLIQENRLVGAEKVWKRAQNNFKDAPAQVLGINLEDLISQMENIFSNELKDQVIIKTCAALA